MFVPGTALQNGRYLLVEQQEIQQWSAQVYEARWNAQDIQNGHPVTIGEALLPHANSSIQNIIQPALRAFHRSSERIATPKLLNVFLEERHCFFVFAPLGGQTLQTHILQQGCLGESEAIACCLHIARLLQSLSEQKPPLVHGWIRPEHIVNQRSRWMLTNGSILAPGSMIEGMDSLNAIQCSPYIAPELTQGMKDVRLDLYALMASIYAAVTGVVPGREEVTPSVLLRNPSLSPSFTALITKGLHPLLQERYQSPSELLQALTNLPVSYDNNVTQLPRKPVLPIERTEQIVQASAGKAQQALPSPGAQALAPSFPPEEEDDTLFLPHPEDLPSLPQRPDLLVATLYSAGLLLGATVFLLLLR